MKTFISILLALLMFLGTSGVFASMRVTPAKQYKNNITFSCWYSQMGNQLGEEYKGDPYSKEYFRELEAWKKAEHFTSDRQVNRNSNLYLTIPVSGELAKIAKYVVVDSDEGPVSDSVTIDGKTYVRSTLKGAELLFYEVGEGVAIPKEETPPVLSMEAKSLIPEVVKTPLVVLPELKTEPAPAVIIVVHDFVVAEPLIEISKLELATMGTAIALLIVLVLIHSFSCHVKKQDEDEGVVPEATETQPVEPAEDVEDTVVGPVPMVVAEVIPDAVVPEEVAEETPVVASESGLREFSLESHQDILNAVIDSGVLTVYNLNSVRFPYEDATKQWLLFPPQHGAHVRVKNHRVNILRALNQLLADQGIVLNNPPILQ